MTVEELIEKLRRPIYNYNMSFHQNTRSAEVREEKAKKEIDEIIREYVNSKS